MRICVYGASSDLIDKSYITAVEELGETMAERGHGLVFGAGAHGLMGAAARGVLRKGGEIIGVTPTFFDVEGVVFKQCTKLVYTETMRERKYHLENYSDAFIMVPGGIGTFDEFFEILTLKQLNQHQKAIVVLNLNGYYDNMRELLKTCIEKGFLHPDCGKLIKFTDNIEEALDYIENYEAKEINMIKIKNY